MRAATVERGDHAYRLLRFTGNGGMARSMGEVGHHPLKVAGRDGDIRVVDEQIAMAGVRCELDQRADFAVGSQTVEALDELNGLCGKFQFELLDCSGGGVGKRGDAEEQLILAGVALAAVAAVETAPRAVSSSPMERSGTRSPRATLAASSPADNNAAREAKRLLQSRTVVYGRPFAREICPAVDPVAMSATASPMTSTGSRRPTATRSGSRACELRHALQIARRMRRRTSEEPTLNGRRYQPQNTIATTQAGQFGRGTSRSSPAAAYSRAVSLVCHTIVIGLPPLLRPSLLFGSNREAGGVRRACCRTRSSPLRRAILKSVAEAEVVPNDPRRRAHSRSQVVTPVTTARIALLRSRATSRSSSLPVRE